MTLEPDRWLFRRLVRLYILFLLLGIAASIYELSSPAWKSFSDDFDLLVARHFEAAGDWTTILAGMLMLIALIWHVSALIGLLKFKRWARLGFWGSFVAMLLPALLPSVGVPYYSGAASLVVEVVASILFGAILLLAYADGLGAAWFATDVAEGERTG